MKVLILAVALSATAVFTGCSQETATTALTIQQDLEESDLPCFDLSTSATGVGTTVVACSAAPDSDGRSDYSFVVFEIPEDKESALLQRCAVASNSERPLPGTFVEGSNWYSFSRGGGLVSPQDISRELGGDLKIFADYCSSTESDWRVIAEQIEAEQRDMRASAEAVSGEQSAECEALQLAAADSKASLTVKTEPALPNMFFGVADTDDEPSIYCPTDLSGEVTFPLPGGGVYQVLLETSLLPEGIKPTDDESQKGVMTLGGLKIVFWSFSSQS